MSHLVTHGRLDGRMDIYEYWAQNSQKSNVGSPACLIAQTAASEGTLVFGYQGEDTDCLSSEQNYDYIGNIEIYQNIKKSGHRKVFEPFLAISNPTHVKILYPAAWHGLWSGYVEFYGWGWFHQWWPKYSYSQSQHPTQHPQSPSHDSAIVWINQRPTCSIDGLCEGNHILGELVDYDFHFQSSHTLYHHS